MKKLQPVRGTRDLLPPLSHHFKSIEAQAFSLAKMFGFSLIETPIFEFSDVFHRTLGETSDVVSKETYDFIDRGGDSLTLRPEGTAGVARAFVSEGLSQHLPLKYYYSGPMFRHERPQKGRYRQFTQIGVEALGYDNPRTDVEVISLGYLLLKKAGLDQKCVLNLNSLGDFESRQKYRDALTQYFTEFKEQLSPESQERLIKNPLRILDSKSEQDQKLSLKAPRFDDFMNEASVQFFSDVKRGLDLLKIPYVINPQLVRGLDYYCHTVFEFVTTELGAQGTVLAGGRYDGLIQQMGGPQVPGVGWGAGLDRLADLILPQTFEVAPCKVALISADETTDFDILKLIYDLRSSDQEQKMPLVFEVIEGSKMGKKFQKADKQGFHYALIIGEAEKNSSTVLLKNLKTGNQISIPLSAQEIIKNLTLTTES